MNIVLLGPPGAGKGTLAALLKNTYRLAHVSTGDILREEMKRKTKIGQQIKRIVEDGKLVPDEVVTQLIENRVAKDKNAQQAYMFDGYPRTEVQAPELDRILAKRHQAIDYALYLEASLSVIIQRLTGRLVCRQCGALFHVKNKKPKKAGVCDNCGGELYQRADDNAETIKTRLDVYIENTKPILGYYRKTNKLITLNAGKDSTEVQQDLSKILNEYGKLNKNKVPRRN